MRSLFYPLVALLLMTVDAHGQEIQINNITNSDRNEISALSGTCVAEGARMHCRFTQTSIRQHKSPESFEEEVRKGIAEATAEFAQGKRSAICEMDNEDLKRALDGISANGTTIAQRLGAQKMRTTVDLVTRTCRTPTAQLIEQLVRRFVETDDRTCSVMQWLPFDLDFVRQASDRWVANQGPLGPCGTVNVITLERTRETLWTYTQRRLVTNRGGGPTCAALEEGTQVFSWNGGDKARLCENIRFGL